VTITLATLTLGVITGMGIGALALGLVLVYRASRVINLAHAELGAAAAAVTAALVRDSRLPYWVAVLVALTAAAAAGAVIEGVVIRPLRNAPRAVVLIATLGVTQLLLAASISLVDRIGNRAGGYPAPFTATVDLGHGVVLHAPDLLFVVVVPVLALLLAAFLRWTSAGTAVRAMSENRDAAQLAGVPVGRIATGVWAVAAVLAAVTTLILLAGKPLVGTESLGPEVLLEALAACVLARFTSLPKALAGGVAIGVVEQVVFYNYPRGGERDLVIFAVILGALLFQSRRGVTVEEGSSWLLAGVLRPVPRALARLRWYPWLGPLVSVAGLGAAALLSLGASNARTLTFTTIAAYAILALSTTLIVGVAGQVSLGQVGFFGLGAAVCYQLSVSVGVAFWLAFLAAGVAGAAASVLVGLPALRVRGLFFAVTSLGFALVAQSWLLAKPWLIGAGVTAPRPILGPIDFAGQHAYFVLALIVLGAAMWLARNMLRSGPGRAIVAVRDNEGAAAAFAVRLARTKLLAFATAGFLAGIAGALYGHGLQNISVNDFPVANPGFQVGAVDSLRIVAIAVIGGLGSIPGAIAGTVLVVGIDQLTHSVALQLLGSSVGLLVLLLFLPGGLASLIDPLRGRLQRMLAHDRPEADEQAVRPLTEGQP
jgi:ABC-type branched-subunit amino acid transport system permease subunit